MKFPKSMHAEGWADHIDTTPSDKPAVRKLGPSAPLRGSKPLASSIHLNDPLVSPSLATTPPTINPTVTPTLSPRIDPIAATARPQHRAAALPPQRDNQLSWMIAAGAGVVVIAAGAIWAVNRPHTTSVPPAVLTGSAEPATQVAAVTPEPPPAAERDDTAAAPSTTLEAAAPARLGPPVTTMKPAEAPRQLAQAAVPAPRPDLVVRAAPRSGALEPLQPSPAPQAPTIVAAAPAMPLASDTQSQQPPTAAGPISTSPGTAPQALPSTSPGTPPVATATPPLAQAQPVVEDSGITQKVRSALAMDSTLAAVPIAVSTDHGVVKLEGQAPDAPTRERATVVASSATGVKAVDNRLTLPPAAVVSQAPTQNGL